MGLLRHPWWWLLKRLKDPATWLKLEGGHILRKKTNLLPPMLAKSFDSYKCFTWPWFHDLLFWTENEVSLPLPVLRPDYYGITQSIPWLLMTWRLVSPGHQQSWYWHRINRSMRKDFNYPHYLRVEKLENVDIYISVSWHKFRRTPVNDSSLFSQTPSKQLMSLWKTAWIVSRGIIAL